VEVVAARMSAGVTCDGIYNELGRGISLCESKGSADLTGFTRAKWRSGHLEQSVDHPGPGARRVDGGRMESETNKNTPRVRGGVVAGIAKPSACQ